MTTLRRIMMESAAMASGEPLSKADEWAALSYEPSGKRKRRRGSSSTDEHASDDEGEDARSPDARSENFRSPVSPMRSRRWSSISSDEDSKDSRSDDVDRRKKKEKWAKELQKKNAEALAREAVSLRQSHREYRRKRELVEADTVQKAPKDSSTSSQSGTLVLSSFPSTNTSPEAAASSVTPKHRAPEVKEENTPKSDNEPLTPSKGGGFRDTNDYVCAVCEKEGDLLLCDGPCLQSFHIGCLGLRDIPDDDQWFCDGCLNNWHECFVCKKHGSTAAKNNGRDDSSTLLKCAAKCCGKYYHKACVEAQPLTRVHGNMFFCPIHTCASCRSGGRSKQSVRCTRCPVAYHTRCIKGRRGIRRLMDKRIVCLNCSVKGKKNGSRSMTVSAVGETEKSDDESNDERARTERWRGMRKTDERILERNGKGSSKTRDDNARKSAKPGNDEDAPARREKSDSTIDMEIETKGSSVSRIENKSKKRRRSGGELESSDTDDTEKKVLLKTRPEKVAGKASSIAVETVDEVKSLSPKKRDKSEGDSPIPEIKVKLEAKPAETSRVTSSSEEFGRRKKKKKKKRRKREVEEGEVRNTENVETKGRQQRIASRQEVNEESKESKAEDVAPDKLLRTEENRSKKDSSELSRVVANEVQKTVSRSKLHSQDVPSRKHSEASEEKVTFKAKDTSASSPGDGQRQELTISGAQSEGTRATKLEGGSTAAPAVEPAPSSASASQPTESDRTATESSKGKETHRDLPRLVLLEGKSERGSVNSNAKSPEDTRKGSRPYVGNLVAKQEPLTGVGAAKTVEAEDAGHPVAEDAGHPVTTDVLVKAAENLIRSANGKSNSKKSQVSSVKTEKLMTESTEKSQAVAAQGATSGREKKRLDEVDTKIEPEEVVAHTEEVKDKRCPVSQSVVKTPSPSKAKGKGRDAHSSLKVKGKGDDHEHITTKKGKDNTESTSSASAVSKSKKDEGGQERCNLDSKEKAHGLTSLRAVDSSEKLMSSPLKENDEKPEKGTSSGNVSEGLSKQRGDLSLPLTEKGQSVPHSVAKSPSRSRELVELMQSGGAIMDTAYLSAVSDSLKAEQDAGKGLSPSYRYGGRAAAAAANSRLMTRKQKVAVEKKRDSSEGLKKGRGRRKSGSRATPGRYKSEGDRGEGVDNEKTEAPTTATITNERTYKATDSELDEGAKTPTKSLSGLVKVEKREDVSGFDQSDGGGQGRKRRARSGSKLEDWSAAVSPGAQVDDDPRQEEESNVPEDEKWVQCDDCQKWRRVPAFVDVQLLPTRWFCRMNKWDKGRSSCASEQEPSSDMVSTTSKEGGSDHSAKSDAELELPASSGGLGQSADAADAGAGIKAKPASFFTKDTQPGTQEKLNKGLNENKAQGGSTKIFGETNNSRTPETISVLDQLDKNVSDQRSGESPASLVKDDVSEKASSGVMSAGDGRIGSTPESGKQDRVDNDKRLLGATWKSDSVLEDAMQVESASSRESDSKPSNVESDRVGREKGTNGADGSKDDVPTAGDHIQKVKEEVIRAELQIDLNVSNESRSKNTPGPRGAGVSQSQASDSGSEMTTNLQAKSSVSSDDNGSRPAIDTEKDQTSIRLEERKDAILPENVSRNQTVDGKDVARVVGAGSAADIVGSAQDASESIVREIAKEQGKVEDEEEEEEKWVQCDACAKWRSVPSGIDTSKFPDKWYCYMNTWDTRVAACTIASAHRRKRRKSKKDKLRADKEKRRKLDSVGDSIDVGGSVDRNGHKDVRDGLAMRSHAQPLVDRAEEKAGQVDSTESVAELQTRASPPLESSKSEDERGLGGDVATQSWPESTHAPDENRSRSPSGKEKSSDAGAMSEQGADDSGAGVRSRARLYSEENLWPDVDVNTQTAQKVCHWAQCEKCLKWRKLPSYLDTSTLPDKWYCSMNRWDKSRASCSAPEEKEDTNASAEGSGTNPQTSENNIGTGTWGGGARKAGQQNRLSYRELIFGANGLVKRTYMDDGVSTVDENGKVSHRDEMYRRSSLYVNPMRSKKKGKGAKKGSKKEKCRDKEKEATTVADVGGYKEEGSKDPSYQAGHRASAVDEGSAGALTSTGSPVSPVFPSPSKPMEPGSGPIGGGLEQARGVENHQADEDDHNSRRVVQRPLRFAKPWKKRGNDLAFDTMPLTF